MILFQPFYIWLIIAFVCLIAELLTAVFIFLPFTISALITGFFSYISFNLYWQIGIFCISSLILLVFIRPLVNNWIHRSKNTVKTGIDAYINQKYKLIEAIDSNNSIGKVKIGSEIWNVRSNQDQEIEVGEMVKIIDIKGTTLIVEKYKE